MPEEAQQFAALDLGAAFPPVSAEDWEAAIHRDLKGADYEKRLVWRTREGIPVRPYYRAEHLAGLEAQTACAPGEFPFVRGAGQEWETAEAAGVAPGAVRADEWHEAGACAVQEVAWAIAAGVDRLAEAGSGGGALEAAAEIEFVFATGSTYFLEIAKLRAARLLWAQAVSAFGLAGDACRMRIHARTSRRNKSVYDSYTNLLRVTTEAMAAAIAGCEKLTVEAFGFDSDLALGVQRVLREEAHIGAVADPAGGSYFVEALTDAVAREAWKRFQALEAEGGYAEALESGAIQRELAASRTALENAAAIRRHTLVGVNNYPDLTERGPGADPPEIGGASAFPAFRLAEPFERLRQRTARHALAAGFRPQVLLLKRGDVKMRSARANFSLNFFGCAGFDVVETEHYAGDAADLIVLCSSDAEYLELAKEVCPTASAPVLVAGNPKDSIAALETAGVSGFVHAASDAVATLAYWQDRLGMEA